MLLMPHQGRHAIVCRHVFAGELGLVQRRAVMAEKTGKLAHIVLHDLLG